MPYKTLYSRRQGEADHLPIEWYLNDAKELSWVDDIYIKRSRALPKSHLRGLIVAHSSGYIPHSLSSNYTIILAHGLEPEMERMVAIKEIMHCYFGPDFGGKYATNSQIALDNHLKAFFGRSFATHSHAEEAEAKALWMALGVICPEHRRQQFKAEVAENPKAADTICDTLQIPRHHVAALLNHQFETEIAEILD